MKQFKISVRLIMLTALLSILLVVVGGMGLMGLRDTNEALHTVYADRTVPLNQLADLSALRARNQIALMDMFVHQSPENIQKRNAEITGNMVTYKRIWEAYLATKLTPNEAEMAKTVDATRSAYVSSGLQPVAQAMLAGRYEEGKKIYEDRVDALAEPALRAVDALIDLQVSIAQSEYEAAQARYNSLMVWSIAAIALGLGIAVVFGWTLIRGITGALAQASTVANQVAEGDLTHAIHADGKDEITDLLRRLSHMQDGLRKVVSTVRQGSEGVATASAQIAQGTNDLSARTENQASALEQTAASMEQLSATVRQNADNARQANQLAQGASRIAVQGGEVVSEVVSTMHGINASSGKIADIISVIDGIAFQTNILALNAAVEAARAGEQGRGFAVVAGEVRTLAQRSAQAAKEIKDLITDSVQRVSQGSALADRAGVTMTNMVESIRQVTTIMAEISAASSEQSSGVTQIGEAVTQMDHVTQQNAALVEEMSAAATNLRQQAQDLLQVVGVFRLQGGELAAAPMPQRAAPPRPVPAPAAKPMARIARPAPAAAAAKRSLPAQAKPAAVTANEGDWESF